MLYTKSYRFYEPVVAAIAAEPPEMWDIDADSYTDDGVSVVLALRDRLATALTERPADGIGRAPTNTLLTKIMLGVFGSVPSFDRFFMDGLRSVTGRRSFGRHSLELVGAFYHANAEAIEKHRVVTIDSTSGRPTSRRYTRAKVIDMVLLIEGGGE
jgi:hypothetical protein